MSASDTITAFSATIAAISFMLGVFAWKREFLGKRRIELAETVLAKFYEAADVIRAVRSPHGNLFHEEGTSRERDDSEKTEESRALNQAHVLFERWNKHRELFAELQSLKYRYGATFGKSALEPFRDLVSVRNDLVIAANHLGNDLWPREARGQLSERDNDEKRKCERHFWSSSDEEKDEIARRVERAVEKIEHVLRDELRSQLGWCQRVWQWCNRSIHKWTWREMTEAEMTAAHT